MLVAQMAAFLLFCGLDADLSTNQLFVIPLAQHRFHLIQAVDSRAHLRLFNFARRLSIPDRAPEIHCHLAQFLSDDVLNDGRCLLWSEVGLP